MHKGRTFFVLYTSFPMAKSRIVRFCNESGLWLESCSYS